MKKTELIQELEKLSQKLFKEKKYYQAGKINLAIDVIQETDIKEEDEETGN